MSLPDFHGLTWTPSLFSLDPSWSIEPHPAAIAELVKSLGIADAEITFLAQGAFNKVYTISLPWKEDLILRIALPVDPRFKTLSEVATMEWMLHNTSAPVPRVVRYGESRANVVGLEWILMTRLEGRHLGDVWQTISYEAKEELVRRGAGVLGELFGRRLRGVGSIYSLLAGKKGATVPEMGRIVSMQFFWGDHIYQDVPRGPFTSSRDWMLARLSLHETESRASLERLRDAEKEGMDSDDEDELESAKRTLDIVGGLKKVVDTVFPAEKATEEEETVFFHHDLSNHNVLVDEEGALTGLLDWECVSAVSLWKACDFPEFLVEKPRVVRPDQSNYDLDNEGGADMYLRHSKEYEVTKLRQVFLGEMERVEPGWKEVFDRSQRERDLDYAVLNCDCVLGARDVRWWCDDVVAGRGRMLSLEERRYGFFERGDDRDTVSRI
ncbi:hypothetical protein VE03_03533 [Pseudogymnoascus sp. 23342-1-I1]|nr:hypothetical protein VE03_03533 [Pseudogymnoascus sp. 23342-1-I1]